jgi:thioesterase domain-containing protein
MGQTPLLLFNPAGASGLCYSELAQQFDNKIPIYCMDDGGILNGLGENACKASSIEEVVEHVQPLVLKFATKFGNSHGTAGGSGSEQRPAIAMGGWSYGGVISVKLTEQLVKNGQHITVDSLMLFDCPLRASKTTANVGGETDDLKPSSDIVDVHFEYCTGLLKKFYAQQEVQSSAGQLIGCDILDIRAEESTYDCGGEVEASLMAFCSGKGKNFHHITPGTHWSMLFGENVKFVVDILHNYVRNKK